MNHRINLSQFVGKTVNVELRSGVVLYSVTVSVSHSISYPYNINGETYKINGSWDDQICRGFRVPEDNDIVKIELSTMKKYEKIENQIAKLSKEVERLKNEEKEEERKNKLPGGFNRRCTIGVLNGKLSYLSVAFTWTSTPQGVLHWENIRLGREVPTNEDIIQLQKWVILSYQQEETK